MTPKACWRGRPHKPSEVLLDAVKRASALAVEVNFCERGRQEALKLLQEKQVAQAVDLLSNLRALFPDNALLERDCISAQEALSRQSSKIALTTVKESSEPATPPTLRPVRVGSLSLVELNRRAGVESNRRPDRVTVRVSASSRVQRAAIAGIASLVLVSAGGTVWKLSRGDAAVSAPAAVPAMAPMISAEAQVSLPADGASAPVPGSAVDGNAQEAQLIERSLPDYPATARERGIFGVVQMEAVIDEQGGVKNVNVVSGDASLASAARNAVLRWKYKPATLNGRPIASHLAVRISFQDRNK